jgi:hypothetical protein
MTNGRLIKFIEIILVFSIAANNPKFSYKKLSELYITSPRQGQGLSGIVPIKGSADDAGFELYELAFSYDINSSTTWFPITTSKKGVNAGLLGKWNTNDISDGYYQLRLRIFLKDGTIKEELIRNLKINNYTKVETDAPIVGLKTEIPGLVKSSTSTIEISATSLEANPIIISAPKVILSLVVGISIIIFLILVVWVHNRFKLK